MLLVLMASSIIVISILDLDEMGRIQVQAQSHIYQLLYAYVNRLCQNPLIYALDNISLYSFNYIIKRFYYIP